MQLAKQNYLVINNGHIELATVLFSNDIKAITQLMNAVFFNCPEKVSFCLEAINRIRAIYLTNFKKQKGLGLIKLILRQMPELNSRIVESVIARDINSAFDYDKHFHTPEEKQEFIDRYVRRYNKIKFDGLNIEYGQCLINHLKNIVEKEFMKLKIDSADKFLDKDLMPIIELNHYDISSQIEDILHKHWNLICSRV